MTQENQKDDTAKIDNKLKRDENEEAIFQENIKVDQDLDKMDEEHEIYMALEKFRKIPIEETSTKQELLFLVGQSGCGKTTFYKNYFAMNDKYKRMTKHTKDGNIT